MAHENLSKGQQKLPETDTFFINSDVTSNNEFSFHNEWLVRGVAVTSGGHEFLEKIKRPKRGDTLLLWVNKIGIVAAGTVLDDAPVIVYRGGGVVSPNEPEEYHRMVHWYADLRSTPVSSAEVVVFHGTNPRQAFGALNKGKEAILALIASRVEQNDIHDLLSRGKGRSTEIEILCQARLGQGRYRDELLALWDRKCAVTGCDLEPVLRASHALSWQGATDQQRLDPHNGLPLISTLDALFDRGLISFADDGAMLCSPSLLGRHRELIGLPAPLRIVLREEQKYYLRMHRQRFAFCSAPQD
jgi:hypothetical protein